MQPATYPPDFHPDSIDTRLVLRIYAWITIALGFFVYCWPAVFFQWIRTAPDLPGVPWGRAGLYRVIAAAVAASGFIAVGLSRIENPVSRRRALYWFAVAHLSSGVMFFIQWHAIFDIVMPSVVAWMPLTIGVILLFIALTCAHAPRFSRPFRGLFAEPEPGPVLINRGRESSTAAALRSQYEEHIRQAARAEERTRLARDLHDAVKQQLFVIQTSAATAQERFDADATGARSAIQQVRASARDALTEMKALIEQLQTRPLENTGLVSALQQQCDALALRTGADVRFEADTLPPESALLPGTQQALFRAAQEALSNIARHARAKNVTVRLGVTRDRFELKINDDGAGFDATAPNAGMGMKNMTARVCEVSGTILLKTEPGRGTLVAFSVPCDTTTAVDYAKRALLWTAVVTLMAFNLTFGDSWEKPWSAMIAAIAAVTVARYAAAWHRARGRAEAAA